MSENLNLRKHERPYKHLAAIGLSLTALTACSTESTLELDKGQMETHVVQPDQNLSEIVSNQLFECDRESSEPNNMVPSKDIQHGVEQVVYNNGLDDASSIAAFQELSVPIYCEANELSANVPSY